MAHCTACSTIDFIIHRLRPSPGVAKSCEIGKMPDITSSVKIQTASTSSVGRKSRWKMCQIFSTNTQRFPWLKVLVVLFLFFDGEFWQTLFCFRHLLELNLRWSKFMQTGTLVIKLSPSSSSSLSWSSSPSPSLSSLPWKIAEFSRRPNDQITIDHTCRGLSEHCLSSKEKIAYRWERNYPKRNINLVRGSGANIMAMTSVTLSSQLKSNFKDPLGRRPGLLTNVFSTHFIFFKDFIPRHELGIFSHYKRISIHGRVAILLQLIESWADYNKTSLWFGLLCCQHNKNTNCLCFQESVQSS